MRVTAIAIAYVSLRFINLAGVQIGLSACELPLRSYSSDDE
jgi:hypothetical protein